MKLDRVIFRAINFYHWYFPHAPDAMYENETRMYGEILNQRNCTNIANSLNFNAPCCYGTIVDPETSTFGILMEDLSLWNSTTNSAKSESDSTATLTDGNVTQTKIRFPNALEDDLSLDELKAILSNLAKLHARYWSNQPDSDSLIPDWIPDPTSPTGMEFVF